MPIVEIVGLAIGLAMDAFAVAVAVGAALPRLTVRHYFRLGFHFGLFQALMPIVGWLAGRHVAEHTAAWDHWLAFGLLLFVGGKMVLARPEEGRSGAAADPTRGWSLVVLSIATSLDALAVGFSLALLGVAIVGPAAIIGGITGALTLAGMGAGRRAGAWLGRWTEKAGGVILIGIGIKIVLEHTLG
jgi:putative Mn2+ efflux pump MntP